jgi:crotonobetainyl-CoA:carnitine CoA-transferase CaiB-like acyl-CoA transferase
MNPLHNLRVLEVTGSPATAIAGGLLADLGAHVIMLEPSAGADLRQQVAFQVWGRGKHSYVTDDLRRTLARFAPGADAVVIDADRLADGDAGMLASVTCVVDVLDARMDRTHALTSAVASSAAEIYGGLAYSQNGFREGPFFLLESPAALAAGILAATGIVLSLLRSDRPGQVVRTSHLAGALALQLFSAVASADRPPIDPPTDGDPHRIMSPTIRFFQTADGWILLGAPNESRWAKLCVALGRQDLLGDTRFAGAPYGVGDRDARIALVDELQSLIRTMPSDHWIRLLATSDVVIAPVLQPGQYLDHPQVRDTDCSLHVEHPRLGTLVQPGHAVAFSSQDGRHADPAPSINQHSVQVLDTYLRSRSEAELESSPLRPPLTGYRVLELATYAAGPGAARLLAGLGAEVVKVESPEGDPFREVPFSFVSVNRGKRSVTLDLHTDGGRQLVRELIAGSDILIHNLRPRLARRLGLTASEIRDCNPSIVQCGVYGFGSNGPNAEMPGIDVLFEALTGGALIQGGGVPVGFKGGTTDNGTALLAMLGIVTALLGRKRGTPGGEAEVSLLRTALYRHAEYFVRPLSEWRPEALQRDPVGPSAAHRLYPTGDGWVLVGISSVEEWNRLRALVSVLPATFAPGDGDWNQRCAAVLGLEFGSQSMLELVSRLTAARIPAVPAADFRTFALQAAAGRLPIVESFQDEEWGDLVSLGELITLEGASSRRLGSAPRHRAVAEGATSG